ncbi:DUF6302 family protein [Streptomyces griseofuscus]|uniref:DUF6302 family protein n=1 Tax=Streptomyces griseofuscus TaxID=146922 RepID=UPI003696A132
MPRFPLARIAAPLCRVSPEECSPDYAWFRERLAGPGLLDCAVGVKVDGAVLIAVPAGGSRSGGYVSVGTMGDAVRVWAALRGRPGFPRVRIGLSVHRDTCHTVNWGTRQPQSDAERGRYFGYAPSPIDAFLLHRSISGPAMARAADDEPACADGRSWQQDPLMSTLRDIGGCLAVILMGIVITLLVSAVKVDAAGAASTSRSRSTQEPASETALPAAATSPSSLASRRWAER